MDARFFTPRLARILRLTVLVALATQCALILWQGYGPWLLAQVGRHVA